MSRVVRHSLVCLFAAACALGSGCEGKNEAQPNPELQVPDVPPGGHGAAKGALKSKDKQPAK